MAPHGLDSLATRVVIDSVMCPRSSFQHAYHPTTVSSLVGNCYGCHDPLSVFPGIYNLSVCYQLLPGRRRATRLLYGDPFYQKIESETFFKDSPSWKSTSNVISSFFPLPSHMYMHTGRIRKRESCSRPETMAPFKC